MISRGAYAISFKESVVLSYAGLRGAINLTLAAAVHQEHVVERSTRDRLLFIVAGIVLLSLLINGNTLMFLIEFLGVNKVSEEEHDIFVRSMYAIEEELEEKVKELKMDPYLGDADWSTVWRYIPVLTAEIYWGRIEKHHISLSAQEIDEIGWYVEQGDNALIKKRGSSRKRWRRGKAREGAGWSFENLSRNVRDRWRRYAVKYNDISGYDSERLKGARLSVYEAIKNHLRPQECGMGSVDEGGNGGTAAAISALPVPRKGSIDVVVGEVGAPLSRASSFRLNRKGSMEAIETPSRIEVIAFPQARQRVLTVLKHLYNKNFQNGLLTSKGLLEFERNIYILFSKPNDVLKEWDLIAKGILQLDRMKKILKYRKNPFVAPIVERYLAARLAFVFELAVNFIHVRTNLRVYTLFGKGAIATKIAQEIRDEINNAKDAIAELLPIFPAIINSAKTFLASSVLLNYFHSACQSYHSMGSLDHNVIDVCKRACDEAMTDLSYHSHSEKLSSRMGVLQQVGFLRFLTQEELETLFVKSHALCTDMFVTAHRRLIKKGSALGNTHWYVVVRGSVTENHVNVLPQASTFGLVESLTYGEAANDYITQSLTHVLVFPRDLILNEAERVPNLLKSLWWYVGIHVLAGERGYNLLSIGELGEFLSERSRFHHFPNLKNRIKLTNGSMKMGGGSLKIMGMLKLATQDSETKPADDDTKRSMDVEEGMNNILFLTGGPETPTAVGLAPEERWVTPRLCRDVKGIINLRSSTVCFLIPDPPVHARPHATLSARQPSCTLLSALSEEGLEITDNTPVQTVTCMDDLLRMNSDTITMRDSQILLDIFNRGRSYHQSERPGAGEALQLPSSWGLGSGAPNNGRAEHSKKLTPLEMIFVDHKKEESKGGGGEGAALNGARRGGGGNGIALSSIVVKEEDEDQESRV